MGSHSSVSYHDVGKRNEHTIVYKDADELQKQNLRPNKITAVKVWYFEEIRAIEVFYDDISAGKRQGNSSTDGVDFIEFILGPDEFIEKITGFAGDKIDMLVFHTTMGRTQTIGREIKQPIKEVAKGLGLRTFRSLFKAPKPDFTLEEVGNIVRDF